MTKACFEKEGITIEWADREKGVDKAPQLNVTSHKGINPFSSHGKLLEEGKADLYNACEWGNYSRVESTKVGSRQIGRRSIVTFAALVVRPDSPVQTPQQFANLQIGVPFFLRHTLFDAAMLEGFVPRDQIKLGRVPNGSPYRFNLLMTSQIEATTLTEPYISLAEKKGCRLVISAFHHGTEVASDRVDAETYSAFNRAVREAVRRINANKRSYLHYFIDYYKNKDPRDREAHDRRSARKSHLSRRPCADPGRRAATHVRLDEELGLPGKRLRGKRARQYERAEARIRAAAPEYCRRVAPWCHAA